MQHMIESNNNSLSAPRFNKKSLETETGRAITQALSMIRPQTDFPPDETFEVEHEGVNDQIDVKD